MAQDKDFKPVVYTIPQIAVLLQISESHAYNLASTGKLPVTRIGRREVVQKNDFEEWLRSQSPLNKPKDK